MFVRVHVNRALFIVMEIVTRCRHWLPFPESSMWKLIHTDLSRHLGTTYALTPHLTLTLLYNRMGTSKRVLNQRDRRIHRPRHLRVCKEQGPIILSQSPRFLLAIITICTTQGREKEKETLWLFTCNILLNWSLDRTRVHKTTRGCLDMLFCDSPSSFHVLIFLVQIAIRLHVQTNALPDELHARGQ